MANWAEETFGQELLTKDGPVATADVVAGKSAVMVYFSADRMIGQGFTSMLADAYNIYTPGDVEIIYVSLDDNPRSFANSFGKMPWTAIPFADSRRKEMLCGMFGISEMMNLLSNPSLFEPKLIVLDGENGRVISRKGRCEVTKKGDLYGSMASWGLDAASKSRREGFNESTVVASSGVAAFLFGALLDITALSN